MIAHDSNQPKVFGIPDSKVVGIIATHDGKTSSIRFNPKYAHRLALQLLDMAERVESGDASGFHFSICPTCGGKGCTDCVNRDV